MATLARTIGRLSALAAAWLAACAPSAPPLPLPTPPELPLRLLGTEPFWAATIDTGGLLLEGADRPSRRWPGPARPRRIPGGWIWEAEGARFTLSPGPCSDGMSDRVYPFTAEAAVGREILNGCAAPLSDLSPRP